MSSSPPAIRSLTDVRPKGGMGTILAACVIAGVTGFVIFASTPVAANAEIAQATEVLRASLDEWKREEAAYRAVIGADKISRAEQDAYAAYVAGLRLRVLEQCEVVRGLGGEEAIAPFECVRIGPEAQWLRQAVVLAPAAVLTDEEKKAAIQADLTKLEGEIDESLQKRQQEIRQTAAVPRGAQAGGAAAGGSGSSGGTAGTTTPSSTGAGSKSPAPPPGQGASASGKSGSEGSAIGGVSRPPSPAGQTAGRAATRERPTDGGVDDDIVARQLREAAERETDPVLKEKLWAEYRKYREAQK